MFCKLDSTLNVAKSIISGFIKAGKKESILANAKLSTQSTCPIIILVKVMFSLSPAPNKIL